MFKIDQIKKMAEKHHFFYNSIKMIHVGGTNGKGSVTSMLSHILMNNYKVGLYQSPYDQKRFDNISINLVPISKEETDEIINLYKKDFEFFKLSEFEIDTWIALAYFHKKQVDFAVIEVGLGGREDATNIIIPILSVITNIGYDHIDVLGNDIKDIAYAKAGIIKKQVPVILGHNMDKLALSVICSYAEMKDSKYYLSEPIKEVENTFNLKIRYKKRLYEINTNANYQIDNASIVFKIIETLIKQGFSITEKSIKNGFMMPIMTKRFEVLSKHPLIIADAAHNKEGALALVTSIQSLKLENVVFITSILKDKPIHEMLDLFLEISENVYITSFDFNRAIHLSEFHHDGVKIISPIESIVDLIKNQPNQTYIFTGSLYFLRTIYPIIKGEFTHGKE